MVKNGIKCLRNEYTKVASTYAKALLFYTFTLAEDQSMRNRLISELDAVAIVSGLILIYLTFWLKTSKFTSQV